MRLPAAIFAPRAATGSLVGDRDLNADQAIGRAHAVVMALAIRTMGTGEIRYRITSLLKRYYMDLEAHWCIVVEFTSTEHLGVIEQVARHVFSKAALVLLF